MELFVAPLKFSNTSLLENIINELSALFNFKITVINLNLDISKSYYKERGQYYSSEIIYEAIKHTKELNGKILILVEFDIFIPVFTYIFGEAQLNGKHSLVSLCRLHEEFYSGTTDDKLLLRRTIKEILHELGHNFGLIHCRNWDCVMHSAQGIEEIDIKGVDFCDFCKAEINSSVKLISS